ncbi:hypothetical protein CHUAL_012836 [Chamberlinius hualienensis]
MPSASNKLEKQASLEVGEPFKQALTVVEKKVRNLEKRKARLDLLKTQGAELHDQQKEALNRYEEVVNTLEFSRDLVKQLTQISQDAAKVQKKQAKRELMEQQAKETVKVREVLMINNVLSTMGDEKIRDDFLNGRDGAVTLSEESLQRLDSLYKMVTPTREIEEDGTPYEQQLVTSSEHLVAILEGKKKEVLGTTYQALRELLLSIHDCAYFKKPEEKVEEPAAAVNGDNHAGSETEQPAVVEESEVKPTDQPVDAVEADSEKVETAASDDLATEARNFQPEDNSVFSTFTHTKPYTDVFTNSQGSFDFLQESQIDPDSPHMDPAVVAAHPMVPPSNRQPYPGPVQPNELLSSQFPNQSINESQHVVLNSSSTTTVPQQPQSHFIQPVQAIPAGHLPDFSQIPTQTYTNQHYVAVPTFAAPIYGQVPTQPVAQNPMIATDEGNWMTENKKHYMNVNATAFESRSFESGDDNGVGVSREDSNSNIEQQSQQADNQIKFNSADNQGYQSGNKGNFQSRSGYNYRGNGGGRGGQSGRGPRGGNGGSVNSSNGGRGSRPGGGGYANNNTRGSGGSGNYQGYRDGYNYQQRESYNGGNGYGSSGPRRGGVNLNQRGNRGELNSRGGSRGGYAKASA